MIDQKRIFQPDWVSPPGDTISDLMEERDWNQVELAQRLGFTTKHLNQLIKGKASLSEDAALRLERVLGSTARFWLNREAIYRERLARLNAQHRYEKWTDWLEILPLPWLKKVGVISGRRITESRKPELVENLLQFFSVASPDEWAECYGNLQGSFRRARKINPDIGAITSWLRMGEIEAEKIAAPKYSKVKFKKALIEIRKLTVLPPSESAPKLCELCSEAGVKLAFVPAVPKVHVSGVTRWLNLHSPLIQLSLYGKTNDKFWFAFFHEAAHILLHSNNKQNIFLSYLNSDVSNSSQEALGYDLAQRLFTQKRNLVLEGFTDYWYVEATSSLLRYADVAHLNEKIALVPANTAGKVVYFATILHAQGSKVAALLDSDSAGEQAAKQDTLVHMLGNKRILRTRDFIETNIKTAEIEDTLRHTLVKVAKEYLSWDIEEKAKAHPGRPIVKIFKNDISAFSKYKLAKAFLNWTKEHEAEDLTEDERKRWISIIKAVNKSLK